MKKTAVLLNILFLLLSPFFANGQAEPAKARINMVGRYTSAGAELRWIPDNKTIMRLGFDNSYTLERSDSGSDKFTAVATIKALPKEKWDSMLAAEKNETSLGNLGIASEFLFADKKEGTKGFSLDKGIGELNEQKNREDMVYAVFVFTAIKDPEVADALGLGYTDRTVQQGKTYLYRIKLNAVSPVYHIENGSVYIKTIINPDKYRNEVFVYPGDKKIAFAWTASRELSGYFVERAAEGETVFKPLNKSPFYASKGTGFEGTETGTYRDDSLTNYKTYRYRFYGNTAFGDKVLFAEVKGMPRDLTPPGSPGIQQPKHVKPNEVLVKWDIKGDLSDLKGFIVARSGTDTGNFTILHNNLLSANSRSYTDTTFNRGGINYYIVYALDTAGNLSASYPAYVALVDSTPPDKPEIISALIDSAGIVTIKIKKGKEPDLKGYRLYKANAPDHEFSVIRDAFKKDKEDTSAIKLVFKDTTTLNSLTPKIYYRVKALDYNYNQSVFSDISAVKRPDTIPPVTPVFRNVIVGEKQIELHFVPSGSIDVKEHILYRKTDLKGEWQIIRKFDTKQSIFIDTAVTTGVTYYYTLRARDESNLYSGYAHPVYGKPYDKGIRPAVEKFAGSFSDNKVILTWNYPPTKKSTSFVIYKKDAKGKMVQYGRTSEKSFIDQKPGKENTYSIKAVTSDGGQSKISDAINIKTN
jgi:uncharacterized protein